jgi:uncharacterized protein (TIGR02145 family)
MEQGCFSNADRKTSKFSRSGAYCSELTSKSPYGMTYTIKNAKPKERFYITVWRNKINSQGCLITSAENIDHLYLVEGNTNGIYDKDWEELSMDLLIPSTVKNEDVKIFVTNMNSDSSVYYDDLCIEYLGYYDRAPIIEKNFVDARDGNIYPVVKIGNQWWTAKNLCFNGKDHESYVYGNADSSESQLGRLYSWKGAMEAIPEGWNLASDNDWKTLEHFLGMSESILDKYGNRGGNITTKLREYAETGFDAKLTGAGSDSVVPAYYNLYRAGYFWTSTEIDSGHAWCREINHWTDIGRFKDSKEMKFSVRCVKNVK